MAVESIGHNPPSPSTITGSQLHHLAAIYPSVVSRVIEQKTKAKAKRKSDGEVDAAVSDFIDLDSFRYKKLPQKLREAREAGKGEKRDEKVGGERIETADIERLVRWKISALNTLCSLRGIGPATATLVLSVADAENVPFFADELFVWLEGRQEKKMKYDLREYERIWEGVKRIREKVRASDDGSENGKNDKASMSAEMIEKAAFVMGNWDLVTEAERETEGEGDGGGIDRADGDDGVVQVKGEQSEKEDRLASNVRKTKDNDEKADLRSSRRRSPDTLLEPAIRRSKRPKR
ncbi:MAG: hypothetical protein Q9160_000111 [Pyrenula sp. 1 TL-2023]